MHRVLRFLAVVVVAVAGCTTSTETLPGTTTTKPTSGISGVIDKSKATAGDADSHYDQMEQIEGTIP